MRRPLIAGNAKMNLNRETLTGLLEDIVRETKTSPPACDVVFCPPFTLLADTRESLAGSAVAWGGQDLHWESGGAFTGEISASMLRDLGCDYAIVGHSERRAQFGETDESVRRKAGAALGAGLVPVVCVGETESEREAGATEVVLSRQVVGGVSGLSLRDPLSLVLAYEPVWAIGTGKTATPAQAEDAHRHLRGELARVLGPAAAEGIRILYGGSVKPDNAGEILAGENVDGALVGGASLTAGAFLPIIRAVG